MTQADAAPERGEEALIKQLRDIRSQPSGPTYKSLHTLCGEAADVIERLTSQCAAYDAVLDRIASGDGYYPDIARAKLVTIRALPSPEAGGDNLGDLNFCKAYWRAPVANCLHLDCVADCNPATAHCGRFAEVCEEHNAKVRAPQAGGDVVEARQIVCEEWQRAVKEFGLVPGSRIETVVGRIIERLSAPLSRAESKSEPTREEVARTLCTKLFPYSWDRCCNFDPTHEKCNNGIRWGAMLVAADAIRALYTPQAERREGWQLVPIEPTDAMVKAAAETRQMQIINGVLSLHQIRMGQDLMLGHDPNSSAISDAYRAMLAAAPPSPVAEGE